MEQNQIKNLIIQIKRNNSQMFSQQSILLQAITDTQGIINNFKNIVKNKPELSHEINFDGLKNVLKVLQKYYRDNIKVATKLNNDFLTTLKEFAERIAKDEKTEE